MKELTIDSEYEPGSSTSSYIIEQDYSLPIQTFRSGMRYLYNNYLKNPHLIMKTLKQIPPGVRIREDFDEEINIVAEHIAALANSSLSDLHASAFKNTDLTKITIRIVTSSNQLPPHKGLSIIIPRDQSKPEQLISFRPIIQDPGETGGYLTRPLPMIFELSRKDFSDPFVMGDFVIGDIIDGSIKAHTVSDKYLKYPPEKLPVLTGVFQRVYESLWQMAKSREEFRLPRRQS